MPNEKVPASRKLGYDDAASLAAAAKHLIVAKGRKITATSPVDAKDADLVATMLGPTGNLRAPTLRVGDTVVVGFSEEAYSEALL